MLRHCRWPLAAMLLLCLMSPLPAQSPEVPDSLRQPVEDAIAKVKPALVRIEVVWANYYEGREVKSEGSGSGVIIRPDGYIVTNHHVAGHATRLKCTLSTREEIEAEIVGKDPLTDLAVIKLINPDGRTFPVAEFGDSSALKVGDYVLAMGSPLSLSQSVTLGIISNTEMALPEWIGRYGGVLEDGEDVGALVLWIGHDAEIFGGNSGGPLVDLQGRIVGINEISVGLGGAIPGSLAKSVSEELIANKKIKRAWMGIEIQPQLKHTGEKRGVLIGGVFAGSPAEQAGLKSGDMLVRIGDQNIDVRFKEQVPGVNRIAASLPIGQPTTLVVVRDGKEQPLTVTPIEREEAWPLEHEIKLWGMTARNLSLMMAREMKRDTQDGVLVTSVRPGGPTGEAKPNIQENDVIVAVNGEPVKSLEDLAKKTEVFTKDIKEPTPVLVTFERKTQQYITVVKVGIPDLPKPGKEVKKAWLPVETQVITREIAEEMAKPDLKGFRVTEIYPLKALGATETVDLQMGDLIIAVDGEPLTASAPEDIEELSALIRQYKIGSVAELKVLRNGEELTIPVKLPGSPMMARELKKARNEKFEFTVREISFFDRAAEKWPDDLQGVRVDEMKSGGWAALGSLGNGDLILDESHRGSETPFRRSQSPARNSYDVFGIGTQMG